MSTPHLALKFPVSTTEFRVIHGEQKETRRYYHESLKKRRKEAGIEGTQEVHIVETDQHRKMNMRDHDPREEERARPEPNEEL